MSHPLVSTRRDGDVVVLTFNRPGTRNALDLAMVQACHRALDDLESDRSLGAIVLTGAGEAAFVAGADIAELKTRDARDSLAGINASLFRRIETFAVPTLAAIRGYALGGGCELALACDLRVSGASAKFGQPEVALGIMPGAGATQRLPRLVGLGRAKELVLTGRIIDAQEALAIGLVNRVVDDEKVVDEALSLAGEVLANGRLAVRLARAALNASFHAGDVGHWLESVSQAVLFESPEKHARMQAFLERKNKKK